MDLSPIGRAAIEAREGNRLTAYRDSKGIWTISVGVTTASGLITVTPGLTLTGAQSDALFATAASKYAAPVRAALVKPVPQPFFDACVSLAYNIGPAGFAHSSVCRLASAGDLPRAIEAFLMWNKPAEIISRRQGERDQAALASYFAGAVFARRGDREPVKAAVSGGLPTTPVKPPPTVHAIVSSTMAASNGEPSSVGSSAAAPGLWSRIHAALSRTGKVA